jgi:hypothetical protein
MRHFLTVLSLVAGLLPMAAPAAADDLTGSNLFLCTAVDVKVCSSDGDCAAGNPWNWNIPQFIEVDMVKKQLATTKASGENRVTPIKNIERADGMIFLQGIERGRAFSFAIAEETGMVSVAVARDGVTVTVFGVCTPTK